MNNFTKLIIKNTDILKNTEDNRKQLLFWLKELPFDDLNDKKSYFERLLNSYISTFFSDKMTDHWLSQFSDSNSFSAYQ